MTWRLTFWENVSLTIIVHFVHDGGGPRLPNTWMGQVHGYVKMCSVRDSAHLFTVIQRNIQRKRKRKWLSI